MARIAEVALFTEDVTGLAAFYELLLGRPPDSRSESHASFELEGATLFIHVAGPEGVEGAPNMDHVAFALDQDAAAERGREAGADVVRPRGGGPRKFGPRRRGAPGAPRRQARRGGGGRGGARPFPRRGPAARARRAARPRARRASTPSGCAPTESPR